MNQTQAKFLRRFPQVLRLAIMAAASLVVIFGLIVLIVWQWYQLRLKPIDPNNTEAVEFVVERDEKADEIAERLEDKELIKSAQAFKWYVRVGNHDDYQAGSFEISQSMSVPEIVEVLRDAQASNTRVTIYPGLRLDEVADSLVEQGFGLSTVATALDASRYLDHPVARWWPRGQSPSLEGYLYPETFNVTDFEQSDADSIIRRSLNEFPQALKDNPDLESNFAARGLTVHQAVVLASIVEQEAKEPEDMPKIAQVFFKRLGRGAALQAGSTSDYAHSVLNQPLNFEINHPYNTHRNPGLPPGPISNVGEQALLAVANPADTDYYFFTVDADGELYFETLKDRGLN